MFQGPVGILFETWEVLIGQNGKPGIAYVEISHGGYMMMHEDWDLMVQKSQGQPGGMYKTW